LPNDAVDIVELRNRPVIKRVAAARELRIVDLFQGSSKPGPGSSLLDNDRNESELKVSTAFFTLQAIGTGAMLRSRREFRQESLCPSVILRVWWCRRRQRCSRQWL